MGRYLEEPRTTTHVVEYSSIDNDIMISEGHMHGWRLTQEDTAFVNIKGIENLPECSMLGLFDGHGGPHVALYAARNFERVFSEELRKAKAPRELEAHNPNDYHAEAKEMLKKEKQNYNINAKNLNMYTEEDKKKTFEHFQKKNSGFVKNSEHVESYHIRQYLYGIKDNELDDNNCIEAFEKMLQQKYKYASGDVPTIKEEELVSDNLIIRVFEDTFKKIDEEIKNKFFKWSNKNEVYRLSKNDYLSWSKIVEDEDDEGFSDATQGCAAEVVLFTPSKVITAHAGDCRTIYLDKSDNVVTSGDDHKPTLESEKNRIEGANGKIDDMRIKLNSDVAVESLSVSRGLGDFPYKSNYEKDDEGNNIDKRPDLQIVSPIPDVKIREKADIKFLVTACDGVWDVLSSEDAVNIIKKNIDALTHDPTHQSFPKKMSQTVKHVSKLVVTSNGALKELGKVTKEPKTTDNISVLLTFFNKDENDKYGGIKNVKLWDPQMVRDWVKTLNNDNLNEVFKEKELTGAELLNITNGDIMHNLGLSKENNDHEKSSEIFLKELERIKKGPVGWDMDWLEAWLEVEGNTAKGDPKFKLPFINFIKYKCNEDHQSPSCQQVMDIRTVDGNNMAREVEKFAKFVQKDEELLKIYNNEGWKLPPQPKFPVPNADLMRFRKILGNLQKGVYNWLKIKKKVDELHELRAAATKLESAQSADDVATKALAGGSKKSHKRTKRRRTKGGKKSRRRLRKRTTLKVKNLN